VSNASGRDSVHFVSVETVAIACLMMIHLDHMSCNIWYIAVYCSMHYSLFAVYISVLQCIVIYCSGCYLENSEEVISIDRSLNMDD